VAPEEAGMSRRKCFWRRHVLKPLPAQIHFIDPGSRDGQQQLFAETMGSLPKIDHDDR
jgi:hypothetical protein